MYRCVAYGVTGSSNGFDVGNVYAFAGNTIDLENGTGDGLEAFSSSFPVIVDNILYDCGNAVQMSSGISTTYSVVDYNLLNSNTTDYTQTRSHFGANDVTTAPAFTDEAGDDYTLSDSSPAINTGIQPGGIT